VISVETARICRERPAWCKPRRGGPDAGFEKNQPRAGPSHRVWIRPRRTQAAFRKRKFRHFQKLPSQSNLEWPDQRESCDGLLYY
jgi:hypothetical protein